MALSALALVLGITACDDPSQPDMDNATRNQKKIALGNDLFNAKSLSINGKMSCATCHSLEGAMVDTRPSAHFGASESTDGTSLGDRNAPTAAYALFSPSFHYDSGEGLYIGGQFLDGREKDLKGQAKGPFLNSVEMQMPNEAAVVEKVESNTTLSTQLKTIYGEEIFSDTFTAYDAIADSIALFEMSPTFAPFDSKYDRYLAGKTSLSQLELDGLKVFDGKAMCSACHPATTDDGSHPLFTDFSYDNLGVPANVALQTERAKRGQDNPKDRGLGKTVNDTRLDGAFKVSSLRNIAVTGPYMHNGVFKTLKEVVHFYNTRDVKDALNPETKKPWDKGEFHSNRNVNELGNLKLSDQEEAALVAFLETLTDANFTK